MKELLLHSLIALSLFASFGYGSKKQKIPEKEQPQYIKDYNAGVDAQQDKNYALAIDYYERAVLENPQFADAFNNLGYCYRQLAKEYLVKAGDAYESALSIEPSHAEALEYQGEYFLLVGQIFKAFQNYQTLKSLNSKEAKELQEKLDPILNDAKKVLKKYSP